MHSESTGARLSQPEPVCHQQAQGTPSFSQPNRLANLNRRLARMPQVLSRWLVRGEGRGDLRTVPEAYPSIAEKFNRGSLPEHCYPAAFDVLFDNLSPKQQGNTLISLCTGEARFEACFLEYVRNRAQGNDHGEYIRVNRLICVDRIFSPCQNSRALLDNLYSLQDERYVEDIVILPSFLDLTEYLSNDRPSIDLVFSVHIDLMTCATQGLHDSFPPGPRLEVDLALNRSITLGSYAQALSSPELAHVKAIHMGGGADGLHIETRDCFDDADKRRRQQAVLLKFVYDSIENPNEQFVGKRSVP